MIKSFFAYYRPHKRLFALDLLCALLVAVCNLFHPIVAKNIINDYVPNKNLQLMLVWCAILMLIYIIKAGLNYFIQYWGHVLGVRIQGDMRNTMFRHIQKLPFGFFDANKTGGLMSRLVNDLNDIAELAHHGPEDMFLSVVSIIGAFVILGTINIYLTLIVFVLLPLIFIFALKTRTNMLSAFKATRETTGEINAEISNSISGVRVTRAYGQESAEVAKFGRANDNFKRARCKAYKAMGVFHSGMGLISDILYLAVLVAGGIFYMYGWINTGEFTAYILFIAMLITPIRTLVTLYEQIQNGMTGYARFVEIMNEHSESDLPAAKDITVKKGNIRFDNVSFQYLKDGKEQLAGVSLDIAGGAVTALVGASGGGKSTVCNLILKFYEVEEGSITLDGVDYREITRQSIRDNIGIVAQDVYIFDGTIRENIAYGKMGATEEEIIESAKSANIHDYIIGLEHGYDTKVGERGAKLSGGQRQRISIARIFLKNPPIIILDEATSALDTITERQIQQALEQLYVNRTVVVVAHRLSTIINADKIYVIEGGTVKESGTHEQLTSLGGSYAALYGTAKKTSSAQ